MVVMFFEGSASTWRLHKLTPHGPARRSADLIAMWADARVTRFIGGEPRAPDVSWGKFLSSAGLWPVMGFGYRVFADRASDALIGLGGLRSEEHTSELQSLMRNSYAVFCLKKKNTRRRNQ